MGQPIDAWTNSGGSQATTKKYYVGLVTNYFAQPGVAEVRVQDQSIALGDSVLFVGATTGALEQKLESMQVERKSVEQVDKGTIVAIKVDEPIRRNDKLYVVERFVHTILSQLCWHLDRFPCFFLEIKNK